MTKSEFKHALINAMYDILEKIPDNAEVDGDVRISVKVKVPKGRKPDNEDDLY